MYYLKKILVTGYNGFIGYNLVRELLDKGYQVIGVSNKERISRNIPQIKKDIRKLTVSGLPKGISHIVHLAAITDISYCQENPSECIDVNVKGTQNMLEIARKINAKFLYLSTSHVYGAPISLPIKENHPRNPLSIYASSKLAGEIISESYALSYNMNLSILRLFSTYGPNSPTHLVTSKIMSQIMEENEIRLGNLYPKRDFLYVKDVVKAIELILRKTKGFNVYNVGSGKSYSILEVCSILNKISGRDVPVKSISSEYRKKEITNVVSDITKIRKLGWRPMIGIDEGLRITFEQLNSISTHDTKT